MMNYKLKGKQLLNGDIKKPEIPYATFDDGLVPGTAEKIVCHLKRGHEMLMIHEKYRSNFHIANVMEMLKEMEEVFQKYDREWFAIQRKY
jgi:hypothetical protein